MDQQRAAFIQGGKDINKIPEKLSGQIFDSITKFAAYGFNKSHSAAYAVISWQTAFFKAHYPVEFMASVLSNEMGNTEKLPIFIAETHQEMGWMFDRQTCRNLLPDLNRKAKAFALAWAASRTWDSEPSSAS